jgi:hypothetical protein
MVIPGGPMSKFILSLDPNHLSGTVTAGEVGSEANVAIT